MSSSTSADTLELARSRLTGNAVDLMLLVATVAGVLILTSLPYAFAYASAPADRQFTGILLNVPDTAQYLSWARESAHSVLIENKLTPERGDAVFFNPFWLVVGWLSVALGLGLAETLQLVRPLAGAVLLGAIYWFVSLVVEDRLERWISFLVAALGGGLGWMLVLQKQLTGELAAPLDLYVTEPNTLLTVMAFPHQAMATGLLVLVLGLSALALERGCFRRATLAGLLALVLGLQHGYDLLVVYTVVGTVAAMLVLRSGSRLRLIGLGLAICGWSAPAAGYLAFITHQSPIWRGVLAQYGNAAVYTPDPGHLLILMGVPLLLVLAGLPGQVGGIRRRGLEVASKASARELLLWSWLIVGFLLLYIPTDFQIKMLAGWQVPVAIVATRVLFWQIVPAVRSWRGGVSRLAPIVGILLVLAVLPTNAYLFAWRFVDLGRHDYPYYLHKDELAALRWLEVNSAPSDVVLSSLTIGQYLPSLSGNNAFLAHWAATLDFYNKRRMVSRFFDPGTPERERVQFLTQFNVRYLFYGQPERALGGYSPDESPYLSMVFTSPEAFIYRVRETPLALTERNGS